MFETIFFSTVRFIGSVKVGDIALKRKNKAYKGKKYIYKRCKRGKELSPYCHITLSLMLLRTKLGSITSK